MQVCRMAKEKFKPRKEPCQWLFLKLLFCFLVLYLFRFITTT